MKITILTVGSRGDVQPYVALGLGLKAAGHDVLLATHGEFRDFVTSHGLAFRPIGGSPREMMSRREGKKMVAGGANPLVFVWGFRRLLEEFSDEALDKSLKACEGAEAIIYSIFAFAGYHIAEMMGVPSFPAFLQPMHRTAAFPLQPAPKWVRSRLYNRASFVLAQQLFGQTFKHVMNEWRAKLGLRPMPAAGLYSLLDTKRLPALYGYSPAVIPKPKDWGPCLHVTGYWFLDSEPGWQPPADLSDFLEAGEPPVYVGFGSMAAQDPHVTGDMVVRALLKANKRGVLMTGWGGLSHSNLPDSIYCLEAIPHDWLFPQMAAVVHHGGAGTTGAGLRAGVPSFAVPFFADQYFWADRINRLGVGPKPIPHDRLTVDALAEAVRAATSSQEMRRRAAAVGERIRAEDGVARAVEAFNRSTDTLKKPPRRQDAKIIRVHTGS